MSKSPHKFCVVQEEPQQERTMDVDQAQIWKIIQDSPYGTQRPLVSVGEGGERIKSSLETEYQKAEVKRVCCEKQVTLPFKLTIKYITQTSFCEAHLHHNS